MSIRADSQIRDIVNQIAQRYSKNLMPAKASGALQDFTSTIEIKYDKMLIYFNLEDYWKYVEYGRKSGKYPPINKIKEWIRIKPIVPRAINGKVPTTNQLAFLISRKIANEGIEAKNYLENTLNESEDLIERLAERIAEQIIEDNENIINDEIS